jgi:hypothetical protein
MGDEQTCGKGLAENAALPAALGAVVGAMAQVLELHMRALDLEDPNAAKEREAYARLVHEQKAIAAELRSTSDRMAGERDLPMGRHDPRTMADAPAVCAFEKLVAAKQKLLALLQRSKDQDEKMLAAMRGALRRTGR